MARIVELKDNQPLVIDPSETQEAVWICRCGLSADWPYCDSSHQLARKEEEGKLYGYHREGPGQPLVGEELPPNLPRLDPRPAG